MKNHIKKLRKERKVTQEDFAIALDVSRQTIVAIENEKYNPSLELTFKMARYFEVTIEEMFDYDE
ncbi:helix-turn-helix transcriptional regulator [Erysipelothrix anatis]|uniref:helix-turn-helix transcriptional regulator n=1 Tax=Erysipelothrix anatis TaxID=2683713 RepID=UPI0013581EF5|nr:helix-turn-helix transcriptional regulator [Erysipelothrix anatis]